MILKAAAGEPIPLYGDGLNVRDWLYVEDHVDALLPAGSRATASRRGWLRRWPGPWRCGSRAATAADALAFWLEPERPDLLAQRASIAAPRLKGIT